MKQTLITTFALAITAAPLAAQEITGASVALSYQDFEDGDLTVTSIDGAVDVIVAANYGFGAAFEAVESDDFDDGEFTATVRGTYYTTPDLGFGLFYGINNSGDIDSALYGIEAAYATDRARFDAYYGSVDIDDDVTDDIQSIGGFGIEFMVGAGVSLGLDYASTRITDGGIVIDTNEIVDVNLTDTSLIARYSIPQGGSVFAKAGRIRLFDTDQDSNTNFSGIEGTDYIAVGAEYRFGGGALFDARPIFQYGG